MSDELIKEDEKPKVKKTEEKESFLKRLEEKTKELKETEERIKALVERNEELVSNKLLGGQTDNVSQPDLTPKEPEGSDYIKEIQKNFRAGV